MNKREYLKTLDFLLTKKENDITHIFEHNTRAFTDTPDFPWTLDHLKDLVSDGWSLYAANHEGEIVAAMFIKKDGDTLLTRNTPIKLNFQGNGFSHQIKDFYENKATTLELQNILNFCRVDNFRGISLNESHGYSSTGRFDGEKSEYAIWSKKV